VLIRRIALLAILVLTSVSAVAAPTRAREWFVRAGSEGGDGSQAKPFGDPWMALDKCEAGDVIHITGGKYWGKLNQAQWVVPFDNIQLIGGYDNDFKTRDPWTNRTELKWDDKSKNWPLNQRLQGNVKGTVIDGLVIDMKDSATYTDETKTSRKDKPKTGENAIDFNGPTTVRNCMIINPDGYAINVPPGSLVENNLVVNAMIFGVSIYTIGDQPAIVRNNTLLFGWGFKEPGKGAYDGALVSVKGPAIITNNIIAHSDSNSIYQSFTKFEKVSITKNVFHQNLYSNLMTFVESKSIFFDDKNMGDLEELGLKSVEGNEILDPGLPYDPAFLDLYSKRTAYVPGKVTMDDMNKLRQLRGLPLIAKGGTPASGVAPAYDLDKAVQLMTPGNEKCKAGARKIPLESKVTGAAAAGPAKTYPKGALLDWHRTADTVTGKPMEMLIAVGSVSNTQGMPKEYKQEQILGFKLYDPQGEGAWVTGFMMKGSNAERLCNAATGRYDGRGKPETLHVVRGIAYHIPVGVPKAAFFIESMEKYEPGAAADEKRPPGRDWFIVAGAAGGNGTKEKPFRDPWQALEKSESGDTIHVAEGEYYGKLKIGRWKIDTRYISLLGGYNKEFTERNPWTHPTLLLCPTEYKGTRGGYTIEGEGEHTGAVVDGFIFDKRTNNQYRANGDIDRDRSDAREHLWLFYPGVVIRNNVFLNGNGGALRVCNGSTIENNIFINHMTKTIDMTKGHTIAPSIIRNNTLMFSWEMRFGEGNGRNGHLLYFWTDSRSIVENNIFEFADNDAVVLSLDPAEITFNNNMFSHNLFSHVRKSANPNLNVDGSNWKQLPDLGFKKAEGNVIVPKGSGCPIDEKFFNVYLSRTAYTPGKVTMDEWNQLREMLGQPVLATGGKGPEGFMPLYPWKTALTAFPKNAEVKAGARIVPLPVKFEGIERKEEVHEYAETNWDAARDRAKWDALANKRVWMKVTMRPTDNQYQLDDIKGDNYTAFQIGGPEGADSPGLPMRCYVKKGTQHERMVKNARDTTRGKPEEFYIIKGIARQNRNMVVEVVEKVD
jgi:hypothetical protein